MTWLPNDAENPDHLRHQTPLPLARDTVYGSPARWYRIHVDYVKTLIALCDYYVHEDAHEGNAGEQIDAAGRWRELQVYFMEGVFIPGEGDEVTDNDFCEMIASCIDAGNLDQTIINRYDVMPLREDPEEPLEDHPIASVPVMDTCDKDALYAACKQMVDWIDELIGQFLNKIATMTNLIELTSYWLDTFPILSMLPFDEILEALGDWLDELIAGYDASFTEDIKRDYYCGLFCISQATCSLNPSEIAQFFELEFGQSLSNASLGDVINAILSAGTSGPWVVHSMFALITYSFAKGFAVLGVSPSEFKTIVLTLTNDSDSDWEVLCDECAENSLVFMDFSESQWLVTEDDDNAGTYENGMGLTCYGHPTTSTYGCRYHWIMNDAYNVQKIEMVVHLKAGASATVSRPIWVRALADGGPEEEVMNLKLRYGATREVKMELFNIPDTRIIEFGARVGSTGGGSYVKIQYLKVWIEGACEPEWVDFCAGT